MFYWWQITDFQTSLPCLFPSVVFCLLWTSGCCCGFLNTKRSDRLTGWGRAVRSKPSPQGKRMVLVETNLESKPTVLTSINSAEVRWGERRASQHLRRNPRVVPCTFQSALLEHTLQFIWLTHVSCTIQWLLYIYVHSFTRATIAAKTVLGHFHLSVRSLKSVYCDPQSPSLWPFQPPFCFMTVQFRCLWRFHVNQKHALSDLYIHHFRGLERSV